MTIEKLGINDDLYVFLTKPVEIPDDVFKTLLPQDVAMYCLLKEIECLNEGIKDIRRGLNITSSKVRR